MDNSVSKWDLPPGFIQRRFARFSRLEDNAWFLYLTRRGRTGIAFKSESRIISVIALCAVASLAYAVVVPRMWYIPAVLIVVLGIIQVIVRKRLFYLDAKRLIGVESPEQLDEVKLTLLTPDDYCVAMVSLQLTWNRIFKSCVLYTAIYSVAFYILTYDFFSIVFYLLGYVYFSMFYVIRLLSLDSICLKKFCRKLTRLYESNHPEEIEFKKTPSDMTPLHFGCLVMFGVCLFVFLAYPITLFYLGSYEYYAFMLVIFLIVGCCPLLLAATRAYGLMKNRDFYLDECLELTDWLIEEYKEKYVESEE